MRGQLFSIDLMVALSIFFAVIGIIAYIWLIIPDYTIYDVQEKANSVSSFLVSTKLGEENILECSKITTLSSKDYNTIKTELNTNPYDVWIEFKNTSAICNGDEINIGSELSSSRVASTVRIVYVDGEKMQMIVRLYD